MKSACVYCFSGTGNTLLATKRLVAGLIERGVPAVCHDLTPGTKVPPGTSGLGIAFPVACQSTYPFVWDFLQALPPGDGRAVFVMDTLHAFSGGLLAPLRRLLVDKGYEPLGAAEITMPSNLRLRCPKAGSEQQVVERAMVDVDSFADDLANGRAVWPKARLLENVLHAVSRSRLLWAFSRWAMNLRHNADQCCTCGFCYEICPVDAINPNRTPVLDRKTCQLCMRCYSYCPVGAIRSRFPWKPYHAVKLDELVGSEEPEAKAGAQT